MRKPGMLWPACLAGLVAASFMVACGGSSKESEMPSKAAPPDTATSAPATAATPSSATPSTPTKDTKEEAAGNTSSPSSPSTSASASASGGAGAKTQRPFAGTPHEATEYIDEAVETRHAEVEKCVGAARDRRKSPHLEIVVELGIDQEGTLIGVKGPKGQVQDKVLFDCIRDALLGAPFPRSKAGVITLKKTFSDQVIYRR